MKQTYEQRIRALAEKMAQKKHPNLYLKRKPRLYTEEIIRRYYDCARIAVAEMAEISKAVFLHHHERLDEMNDWLIKRGLIPDNGQGVGRKIVTLTCENCGTKWQGEEPKMCCNGTDCGCMGLPVDGPICCDEKCFNELMVKLNQNNGQEAGSDD